MISCYLFRNMNDGTVMRICRDGKGYSVGRYGAKHKVVIWLTNRHAAVKAWKRLECMDVELAELV